MNLVKWENNRINIAPEAYELKVFKKIWDSDKDKDKSNAILEFGLIYFMYDPRSPYQYEVDEDSRWQKVLEETGADTKWKNNDNFSAAIPVYKYLTNTTSAQALKGNRKALSKIDEFLDDLPVTEDNMGKILDAVKKKNELAVSIAEAEKQIYKEVEEYSARIRGNKSKTIGDDGLNSLFDGTGN